MTEKHIEPRLRVEWVMPRDLKKGRDWRQDLDYHISATDAGSNATYVGAIINKFAELKTHNRDIHVRIVYFERVTMPLSNGETRVRDTNLTVVAGPVHLDDGQDEHFTDENSDGWFELNVLLPMSPELKERYPQNEKPSLLLAAHEAKRAAMDADEDERDVVEPKAEKPGETPVEEEEELELISPGDTIVAYDAQGNAIEFSIPE